MNVPRTLVVFEPCVENEVIFETKWKIHIIGLWGLLDDIDTAEDMFKPEINAHFKYVHKKHSARWDGPITSDGYTLSWKDDLTAQKEGVCKSTA